MPKFKIGSDIYELGETELEKNLYENLKVLGKAEKYKTQELSQIQEIKGTLSLLANFKKSIDDAMKNYKSSPQNAILTKVGLNDLYKQIEDYIGKTDSKYLKKLLQLYQNKIKVVYYAASIYLAEPQNAVAAEEFKKKIQNA